MPKMFPWNRHPSQICCYSDNTEMLGFLYSSHSPTWQHRTSSWSPLLLLRGWRLTLHLLQRHYCHTSLHSDPLPDRNKVMDRTSFNEKADLRLIFPKPFRRTTHNSLSFHNTSLTSSSHLHNQGIILDSCLLLEHHTNHITKKISFHLKNITSLCPPLFFSTTETLIDTFIWSRLD